MRILLVGLVVCILILLTACGLETEQNIPTPGQHSSEYNVTNPNTKVGVDEQGNQLWIMSFYDLGEQLRSRINKQFSRLEIQYTVTPLFNGVETFRQTYTTDRVPDLLIMDYSWLGSFNDTDTFEDLSKEPYQAEALISIYPNNMKQVLRSLDNQKLLALPIYTSPAVTFYRYDILKEAGFPAEPDKLAAFMEDSNNWLYMTQTLKEQGFYTHSWSEEPSFYLDYSMGMFDNNMTYLRNTKKVFPIMDLARETFKQELASNSNLFEPSVNHSITLGNTVMVHTGLLFENILKEVGSNSAGNWRITTMPFGMYGLSGHAVAAISSTSKHKSEAWNVIEWMAEIDKNKIQQILNEEAFISGEDFYGGQHIAPLLRNLIERSPEYQLTPVDERAKNIWWRVWFEGIQDTNLSTEMLLSNIERAINNELSDEIKITREFLQEIPK